MKRVAVAAITVLLVATACSSAEVEGTDPEQVAAPDTTTLATTTTTQLATICGAISVPAAQTASSKYSGSLCCLSHCSPARRWPLTRA